MRAERQITAQANPTQRLNSHRRALAKMFLCLGAAPWLHGADALGVQRGGRLAHERACVQTGLRAPPWRGGSRERLEDPLPAHLDGRPAIAGRVSQDEVGPALVAVEHDEHCSYEELQCRQHFRLPGCCIQCSESEGTCRIHGLWPRGT